MFNQIAADMQVPAWKVEAAARLLKDGNTVPFIARYRKEATGLLDEIQLRRVDELVAFYETLAARKSDVIRLISEQGLLTEELQVRIEAAARPSEVEDLYRPYRPKRKTRASAAREKGLQPLADFLLSFPQGPEPEQEALKYVNELVPDADAALKGAADIVAEYFSDLPEIWKWVREFTFKNASLSSRAVGDESDPVYRMYFDYQEPVRSIRPHRVLAVNRGERQGHLKVQLDLDPDGVLNWMVRNYVRQGSSASLVRAALEDAYKRLIAPAVERDIRSDLTAAAEKHSIDIYGKNLRQLLLQRPVPGRVILGLDPAYRTGVKLAVIEGTGKLLETGVIYPTPPQNDRKGAERQVNRLIDAYGIDTIVIGNGTASRETEEFVAEIIAQRQGLAYVIVNEAGASVYSASELAASEFPDLDVSHRSAVSIARRLQDPLSELVKIDPKAMGIGQYQHDMPPRMLNEALTGVVESAVNYVGVDLNTASSSLLRYVAGLNASTAGNIVKYREENGAFTDRKQLLKVPKLGPKAFQQSAGFLRIAGGASTLDNTPIHPESYELTGRLLAAIEARLEELDSTEVKNRLASVKPEAMAEKLGAGAPTVKDILEALLRPGRDPREELPQPIFRSNVLKLEDLQSGMELEGEVRNLVDFGAFVDIGLKDDGLVHISEMSERRIKHPAEVISVGDIVRVRVLSIDQQRRRVALSMKGLS